MRLNSVCEITACSVLASIDRIWFCCPAGYISMIRSTVCDALTVCSVERTRWPVSAAEIASGRRLEVTHLADEDDVRILTQGVLQTRGEARHVLPQLALLDQALVRLLNAYSTGSSSVMMCLRYRSFIASIIAASVVVLPEPVSPVTSTRPRGR